ncbi:MAG TPA: hypothetical protein VJT75_10795 [Thermoleophilaceae bacterium]|nr:hypothetical protein [Thermoleophilaceae bacterium]
MSGAEVSVFGLERMALRGRAASLRASGAIPGLVRELGDNYDAYHADLAAQLESNGGRPEPEDFPDDFAGYAAGCAQAVAIVATEQFLRACRRYRVSGAPLDARPQDEPRLVDEYQRLVSVVTGKPSGRRLRSPAPPAPAPGGGD